MSTDVVAILAQKNGMVMLNSSQQLFTVNLWKLLIYICGNATAVVTKIMIHVV